VPELLIEYPEASFGFCSSRTIDPKTKTVEGILANQRYRIYTYFIPRYFGSKTFKHFEYPKISSYLLVNKKSGMMSKREKDIVKMFSRTYVNLPDI
jgi:hypothetical protein